MIDNFYDQNINDTIKMNDEIRNISLGKSDDYTVGCLLDYHYFKDNYKLVCCNLSMQSILDSDPRALQQTEFIFRLDYNVNAQILTVLEKEKKTVLEFIKGTVKVL